VSVQGLCIVETQAQHAGSSVANCIEVRVDACWPAGNGINIGFGKYLQCQEAIAICATCVQCMTVLVLKSTPQLDTC
jgi:hypothetical protein